MSFQAFFRPRLGGRGRASARLNPKLRSWSRAEASPPNSKALFPLFRFDRPRGPPSLREGGADADAYGRGRGRLRPAKTPGFLRLSVRTGECGRRTFNRLTVRRRVRTLVMQLFPQVDVSLANPDVSPAVEFRLEVPCLLPVLGCVPLFQHGPPFLDRYPVGLPLDQPVAEGLESVGLIVRHLV